MYISDPREGCTMVEETKVVAQFAAGVPQSFRVTLKKWPPELPTCHIMTTPVIIP